MGGENESETNGGLIPPRIGNGATSTAVLKNQNLFYSSSSP